MQNQLFAPNRKTRENCARLSTANMAESDSLVIKKFKDGEKYVCSWELKFKGSSISRNTTADLPSKLLHHTRNQRDIM